MTRCTCNSKPQGQAKESSTQGLPTFDPAMKPPTPLATLKMFILFYFCYQTTLLGDI